MRPVFFNEFIKGIDLYMQIVYTYIEGGGATEGKEKHMKLSKAQEKVLSGAKMDIDKARACETFEEYFNKHLGPRMNHLYDTPDKYMARDMKNWNRMRKYWEMDKEGIVLTHCSSKTIEKLEKLGLIEILYDSNGEYWGMDRIKVLNY